MRVSQNYVSGLELRNFTSTPFEDWVKIGVFGRLLPANPWKIRLCWVEVKLKNSRLDFPIKSIHWEFCERLLAQNGRR